MRTKTLSSQPILPFAELIDIMKLPSLSINDLKELPKLPGIYFVIEGNIIHYIGRTKCLYERWKKHQRLNLYALNANISLAWLIVSNHRMLPAIESACIAFFHPKDNEKSGSKYIKEYSKLDGDVTAIMVSRKTRLQLRHLSADHEMSMRDIVSALVDYAISTPEFLTQLLRPTSPEKHEHAN